MDPDHDGTGGPIHRNEAFCVHLDDEVPRGRHPHHDGVGGGGRRIFIKSGTPAAFAVLVMRLTCPSWWNLFAPGTLVVPCASAGAVSPATSPPRTIAVTPTMARSFLMASSSDAGLLTARAYLSMRSLMHLPSRTAQRQEGCRVFEGGATVRGPATSGSWRTSSNRSSS